MCIRLTTLANIATLFFTILAKKIIFSNKADFDFGGYVNKQNGAQKTPTHTLKSRCTQNESLFGADFGPKA